LFTRRFCDERLKCFKLVLNFLGIEQMKSAKENGGFNHGMRSPVEASERANEV